MNYSILPGERVSAYGCELVLQQCGVKLPPGFNLEKDVTVEGRLQFFTDEYIMSFLTEMIVCLYVERVSCFHQAGARKHRQLEAANSSVLTLNQSSSKQGTLWTHWYPVQVLPWCKQMHAFSTSVF